MANGAGAPIATVEVPMLVERAPYCCI